MITDNLSENIREKTMEYGLEIEADGITYLEELVENHPVEIDMVMQALRLHSQIRGIALNCDNIKTYVNECLFSVPFYVIVGHVCRHYGVQERILRGLNSEYGKHDARLAVVYLLHTYAKQHLPYIGYWLNRDSHLAACMLRTAKEKMSCDDNFRSDIHQLAGRIAAIAFNQFMVAFE